MNLEYRHLREISALAEHGTFQRAARSLGLSQPSLSRSLQGLERELGARLFDRGGPGGLQPTELGCIMLERGARLLEGHGDLLRELRLHTELDAGHVSVSAGVFPASISVYRAVGRLVRKHPGIRVRVRVDTWRTCMEDVLVRDADLAVADVRTATDHPQLDVESIAKHAFVFVCRPGHPILAAEAVSPDLLFSYPFASTRAPAQIVRHLPRPPFAAGHVEPSTGDFVPAILAGDVPSGHDVVRGSDVLGVAASPHSTGRPLPPGLVHVPFDAHWMRLDYGLITLKGRTPSPATEALMREVRAVEASPAVS